MGNTWLSQAARIFTLKEMLSEQPFFITLLALYFYVSSNSGLVTDCKRTLGRWPGKEIGKEKEMSVAKIFHILLLA